MPPSEVAGHLLEEDRFVVVSLDFPEGGRTESYRPHRGRVREEELAPDRAPARDLAPDPDSVARYYRRHRTRLLRRRHRAIAGLF